MLYILYYSYTCQCVLVFYFMTQKNIKKSFVHFWVIKYTTIEFSFFITKKLFNNQPF